MAAPAASIMVRFQAGETKVRKSEKGECVYFLKASTKNQNPDLSLTCHRAELSQAATLAMGD